MYIQRVVENKTFWVTVSLHYMLRNPKGEGHTRLQNDRMSGLKQLVVRILQCSAWNIELLLLLLLLFYNLSKQK